MRAAGDVAPGCDSRLDEIVFDVPAHVARRRTVKRQVAAFSADHQFVTSKPARLQVSQRRANRSFTSLKAIVRGRVDCIRAQLNRAHDGFRVAPIRLFIRLTKIRSDADGRQGKILRLPKVALGRVFEARAITRSSHETRILHSWCMTICAVAVRHKAHW